MKAIVATFALVASIGAPGSADRPYKKTCFELGDGSSRSYEAAWCGENGDIPAPSEAFVCNFKDGYKTTCFKRSNGCFVCEGMD